MKKAIFAVGLVLSISSVLFGQNIGPINQLQNTTIGLGNTIQLLQGHQAADAIQNLAVSNDQAATRACGAWAGQSFLANLAEIGHASGDCGIVSVLQELTGVSLQAQLIGDACDPKTESQTVTLGAGQTLAKSEGPGAGSALHQIVLRGEQGGDNRAGNISQASAILGLQSSSLTGAACATGAVNSAMNVCTVQTHATQ
ncbi:MAG: hypothetical protein JW955_21065 [Sedimentisphaerales bacterium]|nr:hypothetical protein [Sedimentisphaerales bacterium]